MTDMQTTTGVEIGDAQPGSAGSARRVVLLGAGAVGATAVLATCGTSTTNTSGTDYSNTPPPAGSVAATGGPTVGSGGDTGATALAKAADVPVGGGIIAGEHVITQPVAGTFKAFSKVCTHAGCAVSKVDGGVIKCPCHGSTFSITDGSPTAGPAKTPLAATAVKESGGNIVAA